MVNFHFFRATFPFETGRCPLVNSDNKHKSIKNTSAWIFQLNGLKSTLRKQFMNKMISVNWITLPSLGLGSDEGEENIQSLFFCICDKHTQELSGRDGFSKLTMDMIDGQRIPMEFITQILNILEQLGFSIFNCSNISEKENEVFSRQQIWTFASTKESLD